MLAEQVIRGYPLSNVPIGTITPVDVDYDAASNCDVGLRQIAAEPHRLTAG
jgi:hypothetical protein